MATKVKSKQGDLEGDFYRILEEGYQGEAHGEYDYLILFSGGKDSTYLAHKLRQAKGGRVCLLAIDNGIPANPPKAGAGNCGNMCLFTAGGESENRSLSEVVTKVSSQLEMDLFIYRPPVEHFRNYYKFLIMEDLVKEVDSNPLCFFCGRYFMALGLDFAAKHNIPFVFYGATPMQVNQEAPPRTFREIELFDMVSRRRLLGAYKKFQESERYQKDPLIRKIIDRTFYSPQGVKLMFPYLYIDYNIDLIKSTLEKEYGWKNPTGTISNVQYITSGCPMVLLFGLLSKVRSFGIHEMEQMKQDYLAGGLSTEAYDYNKDIFENLMSGQIEPKVEELAHLIGVEDILLKKSPTQN